MAKLYYRHGTMGSSKTANALMVDYSYRENGRTSILLKPAKDTRDGVGLIRSRSGLSAKCLCMEEEVNLYDFFRFYKVHPVAFGEDYPDLAHQAEINSIDVIIVDEAQFLTAAQVDQLAMICDDLDIPVIAYGLRTDFTGHLFEGSKRLFEVADKIEEVKHICWCGKKAIMNARYNENGIVRNGEQIVIGANESYVPLCRHHYLSGETHAPAEES